MNKKTKNVIIALIVIVLALGCGSIGLVAADKHIEAVETTSIFTQATQGNGEEHDDNQSDSDSNDSTEAAKADGGNNKTENTSSAKSNTDGKKSQGSDSGKSQGNSGDSGSSGGSSQSNNKASPTTTKPQQTAPAAKKTYTCTVTIDCSVILHNMGDLTEGKEAYVPSNGYILKNYTIKAQEGESVYSLLKRACEANGIPYNEQDTSWGKYISSINNLAEKDCGSGSGWIYTVNGKFINRTCEKEKIKSNSTIIWEYVV